MKTLPLEAIPSRRMRSLTSEAARENRQARIERVQAKWEDYDAPPPPDPLGEMIVFTAVILAAVFVVGFVAGALVF